MSTKIQEFAQAPGPRIPTAEKLGLLLLRQIASHFEIRAISINGQTGIITVEYTHDDIEQTKELN